MTITRFFNYARERHAMYLRRTAGESEPWTRDKILYKYRFTNVFRELDKTTAWFARSVRDPFSRVPEVLLATVVFRMLNRIEVGEAVFCQTDITYGGRTAFDEFARTSDPRVLRRAIKQFCGRGPYVTGAYIISSPAGYSKLDGVTKILGDFAKKSKWEEQGNVMLLESKFRLQDAHEWISGFAYFGHFHSYEIVTDLRYTDLLRDAPDVMTWCNVGPGARRGLNRVAGRDVDDHSTSTEGMLTETRHLLAESKRAERWPQWYQGQYRQSKNNGDVHSPRTKGAWPAWEMREVEHTLCEFDKYERVRLGEGRPRGVYR